MSIKGMQVKDPGSAITHFIGSVGAALLATPLLIKANHNALGEMLSLSIFIFSMFLLYTASTLYHTINISDKVNKALKKFDHMSIYVLIAGTYTPICVLVLNNSIGYIMLAIIWGMAALGICFTAFWVTCPKWLSATIYIIMGWTCVMAFGPLLDNLSKAAFGWLLTGGIIYTIGGIIYALKLPIFNNKHKNFGSHEIFHLFCLGGSFCHFILIYTYIAGM